MPPVGGIPAILPRKFSFRDNIHRYVPFAEKVVLCYRCKIRHMLGENCPVITPTQKDSSMSFTEQSATPSQNPSPAQPDHSAKILPCVESLQQPYAPTKDVIRGIALDRFLIRIRILNQTQSHALILIHMMNLTLDLSILWKNLLHSLRWKLHQRFLQMRSTWGTLLLRSQIQMYIRNVPSQ